MTPWVTRLLLANVVMFFATRAAPQLAAPLIFIPGAVLSQPWTLVTYQFLHGDFFHLLGNMFGLFFLGPRVEARLGGRRFITLYFLGGITGALLSIPLAPGAAIIGASGAVFAVLLAFARYWPHERLLLWGVLPIESRLFVVLLTAISLWSGFTGAQHGIAHFAHLGGFLGGWLYLVWLEKHSPARAFRQAALGPTHRTPTGGDLTRWSRIPREQLHEVNRAEVDRVMEKARAGGPTSLSAEERAFLDRLVP
ncbi:MAG TPA: rhomboid family intramembrane serine protease [Gemmatimonadales bacterium]|nr:rhomboid family intramembrane serine protease [Gemmatimonadales bacterium]